MSDRSDLEAALPELLTAYRRGLLVPFIGSGMSVPACRGWVPFVVALAEQAECRVPPAIRAALDGGAPVAATELYRLADLCVRRLKARGEDVLAERCLRALYAPSADAAAIPAQTRALAEIHWPLVLSTNYDDLLLRAAFRRRAQAQLARVREGELPSLYELAGQSVGDCHAVLRSLDTVSRPTLWALQGYLGDQKLTRPEISDGKMSRLRREVVIGHRQYQAVINAQPHLRRAVAEVFRRRVLLFLGSGVQEDYLVNLFSEIIHHHGMSLHRHYAVFHEAQRDSIDEDFFRLRLGIQPLFVSHYDEIPALLTTLKENIRIDSVERSRGTVFSCGVHELTFRFHGTQQREPFLLRLRNAPLELPPDDGCVGVSVGRSEGRPRLGKMAHDVLAKAELRADTWSPDEESRYLFRHDARDNVFAIAARDRDDHPHLANHGRFDRRHLLVIPAALRAFLERADASGYRSASVGLLSAGKHRPWPALYPFVMMLRAVRELAEAGTRSLRELAISIIDPAVWYPILAGKLSVDALLSSHAASAWVHIASGSDAEVETYPVVITGSTTVEEVARQCGLGPGWWRVAVFPVPSGTGGDPQAWAETAVVPGATVTFFAAAAGEDGAVQLAG